jgi:PelA/Pel-15E family pectate lyase
MPGIASIKVALMKLSILFLAVLIAISSSGRADDGLHLKDAASAALMKAGSFYHNEVSTHGGYVYFYSLDLKDRWGEGPATPDQVWVQPPGTPTVGLAFLQAWEATGDRFYLDAARDAATTLAYGQLRGGGWTNSIDLSGRSKGSRFSGGNRRKDGNSSLDDGQTQSAIQLVIRTDQALGFKDEFIHDSAMFALDSLLAAQFPNGAFPQVWTEPVSDQPVRKASYPSYDWRTEGRIKNYWDMYTLNDNVCDYVADTLIDAHRIYGGDRYLNSLLRLGDFLILAQMPEPQPGWAQQYNYQMYPIWARRFEPAAMAGDETQEAIGTLMKVATLTGDAKYLEPIPAALAWLKRSLLNDGQIARYYELETNRPLYMSRRGKEYSLTYDDSKLPKHYGWKWPSRIEELSTKLVQHRSGNVPAAPLATEAAVRKAILQLDEPGRWISTYDGVRLVGQAKMAVGTKYLSSEVFSNNLTLLSDFISQKRS